MVALAEQFDVVVVGGGPAGYGTALYASGAGMKVALVEKEKVGGTCLHRGCIPAKEFLETASVYRTVAGAAEFGVEAGKTYVKFAQSAARKRQVVQQLYTGLQGLLKKRRVATFTGFGRLGTGMTVEVTGAGDVTEVSGRNVVLAAGSVPRTIPGFDIDGKFILSSDEVLELEKLPTSVAVIGGGAIGCEFASMMADLGSRVTLLEVATTLLPGCDPEVAQVVARVFAKKGIDVRTGITVHGHAPKGGVRTNVSFGDGEEVTVEAVVVSVGRRPLSDGLVAPGRGVSISEKGFVSVDPMMCTTAPGVYAVGDLVATPQLAHVGFAEAIVAVKHMLGEPVVPVEYDKVPWCIYSHPEVAFAGMTEDAAKAAGHDVVTHKSRFAGNSRAMILGETEGMVKIVAARSSDGTAGPILGVHMVGPWVTEQLGQGYLSVNWEASVVEAAAFIQPHPTLSETFGEAVLAMTGRGLHA